MIHRIEPGFLRTNDALNKRDRRQGRRRPRESDESRDDAPVTTVDLPAQTTPERASVALDLVA